MNNLSHKMVTPNTTPEFLVLRGGVILGHTEAEQPHNHGSACDSNQEAGTTSASLPTPSSMLSASCSSSLPAPCSQQRSHTEAEHAEANRRLGILRRVAELVAAGLSQKQASLQIGEDPSSICRWRQRLEESGIAFSSLLQAPCSVLYDLLVPHHANSGRRSEFTYLLKDTAFTNKLLSLYLSTLGGANASTIHHRNTAKMATALQCMADEPECPADLASKLRLGQYPDCILRFLRKITPEIEARIRGPKHTQLQGLISRKDNTIKFSDGSRAEMPAGFCWVFDDMSSNQPFWTHVDGQLLFSRQGLYCIDRRSKRWLGKMLVARPREAYRAEDILRFIRSLMEIYGKPDQITLERGVWHARAIRGYDCDGVVETESLRPELLEPERQALATGLESIGVKIHYAYSAHDKIIEGAFNYLQDIMAIKTRDYINIGRHAGEFELPAKRLRQLRNEVYTPDQLGFISMPTLSARIDEAFQHINGKINSNNEIPDQIWFRDTQKRPLIQLAPQDQAAFLPCKEDREIVGGRIVVRDNDYREPWMVDLGTGFRVYVRFDPLDLQRGIAVYNRETRPNNTSKFRIGEFLGWARWEMPAPAAISDTPVRGINPVNVTEIYGQDAIDQGASIRKEQRKRVAELSATIFTAIPKPGQPALKRTEATDGSGSTIRSQVGRGSCRAENPTGPIRVAPKDNGVVRSSKLQASSSKLITDFLSRRAQNAVSALDD